MKENLKTAVHHFKCLFCDRRFDSLGDRKLHTKKNSAEERREKLRQITARSWGFLPYSIHSAKQIDAKSVLRYGTLENEVLGEEHTKRLATPMDSHAPEGQETPLGGTVPSQIRSSTLPLHGHSDAVAIKTSSPVQNNQQRWY